MKRGFTLFCAAAAMLLTTGSVSAARKPAPAPRPKLTAASVAPPVVDLSKPEKFDELRAAYARRADFARRCESGHSGKSFMALMDQRDFVGASTLARQWLAECPVDAQVHLWALAAFAEQGDRENSDIDKRWFTGLTESALASGNGRSPETAIETISVGEEYAVLRRMGLKKKEKAVVQGKKRLDAILATDESGVAVTIYFNPEWHFVRLAHVLEE